MTALATRLDGARTTPDDARPLVPNGPVERLATLTARGAGTVGRLLTFDRPGRTAREALRRVDLLPANVDPRDPPWCTPHGASWTIYGDPGCRAVRAGSPPA